jgi:hypothetical protein
MVVSAPVIMAQAEPAAYHQRSSLSALLSYAPNSGKILIGESEDRRITTFGVEYARQIWSGRAAHIDYRGEFSPYYRESDPTAVGTEFTILGSTVFTPFPTPFRVVSTKRQPIGNECYAPDACSPIYLVFGQSEITHGFMVSPLGARAVFLPDRKLAPTFEAELGMVFASRQIPIDLGSSVNYEFGFGPGVQWSVTRQSTLRFEYIFRHISNANMGTENPGIDQGVYRLSISRHLGRR